ncbi:MAG: exodeoxyribonuclease III [Deltaproteobacteria bacterium]|nr:exodeoxyribonuclease III [Deltaproteobacteria bacterium]
MDLYSWNVNGIRAIKKKGFDKWVYQNNPDILCLQETKISQDLLTAEVCNLDGYHSYWSCAQRKGYSGVAIWSKAKPLEVKFGLGIEKFDLEGRTLVLKYPKFTLLNVYFPNGGNGADRLQYKLEFYEAFLKYCKKLIKNGEKVIFCGDVNTAHRSLDLADPQANKNTSGFLAVEREWIDKVIKAGFVDSFRLINGDVAEQYSWWDYRTGARARNVGWRIDYFFVCGTLKSKITGANIFPEVLGSDHCPIKLQLVI